MSIHPMWLQCHLHRGRVSTVVEIKYQFCSQSTANWSFRIAKCLLVQPLQNSLSNTPNNISTNSPPRGQQTTKPLLVPTSSMAAGPSVPSAQSTPTSDISQAKPITPKAGTLSPLEQERVSALLHLNALILRELQTLQTAGAATASVQPSPQQQKPADNTAAGEAQKSPTAAGTSALSTTPTNTPSTPQTPKFSKPSTKLIYDNYLKRLQVNIAYLLALSQVKPIPPHPLAMEPPPDSWSLPVPGELSENEREEGEERGREVAGEFREAYQKLKELWPNYRPKLGGQVHQQGQNQQQGQQAPQVLSGQLGQGVISQPQAPIQGSAATGILKPGQPLPQATGTSPQ